jgi:hypothetical protein
MTLINESPPVLYIQKPSEQHITIRKIRSFLRFPPGWNYGEGNAFDEHIINSAIELHKIILSLAFNETDAFPGTDGSIIVTVYHGDYCLEFTIKANGNIYYVLELNDAAIHQEENLTLPQAKDILRQFRRERWRPFDSSTFGTTTVAENVFVPQLLHISARGFLLLIDNVSLHLA